MAEGQEAPARGGGTNRAYIGIGITLGVLTVLVLILAYAGVPIAILAPIVVILAAIQVYLQADVWMHLNRGRRLYRIFFIAGGIMALEVFLSALVLMWTH